MFEREFIVRGVEGRQLLAEPLDGSGVQRISVAFPGKYIENEVLVLGDLEQKPDGLTARVLSCRRDPSCLKATPPRIEDRGDGGFQFQEHPTSVAHDERFRAALELRGQDLPEAAAQELRDFLSDSPLHMDTYHHLGVIEWEKGSFPRAEKYYEMAYRIGLHCLPPGFQGRLPWTSLENRPFLRASHSYALCLRRKKRFVDACLTCEQILRWDPDDHLGIRFLLPEYYFAAKASEQARRVLELHGADRTNAYTLCLLNILDGRRKDALRSLCAAVMENAYVPLFLLKERDRPPRGTGRFELGGEAEAIEYLSAFETHWKKGLDFLEDVMEPGSPFRTRLDRYIELRTRFAGLSEPDERMEVLSQMRGLFDESGFAALLDEIRHPVGE